MVVEKDVFMLPQFSAERMVRVTHSARRSKAGTDPNQRSPPSRHHSLNANRNHRPMRNLSRARGLKGLRRQCDTPACVIAGSRRDILINVSGDLFGEFWVMSDGLPRQARDKPEPGRKTSSFVMTGKSIVARSLSIDR